MPLQSTSFLSVRNALYVSNAFESSRFLSLDTDHLAVSSTVNIVLYCAKSAQVTLSFHAVYLSDSTAEHH